MKQRPDKINQGIIMSGGSLDANNVAVGESASIISEQKSNSAPTPTPTNRDLNLEPTVSKNLRKAFISYASEDKAEVAGPLAAALIERGVEVWFDEVELAVGDSLREKIDHALASSHIGIVIISRAFTTKGWTQYELNAIVSGAISGKQILFPIWHRITGEEVARFSPTLVDRVARSTSTHSIEAIAREICELIKE